MEPLRRVLPTPPTEGKEAHAADAQQAQRVKFCYRGRQTRPSSRLARGLQGA